MHRVHLAARSALALSGADWRSERYPVAQDNVTGSGDELHHQCKSNMALASSTMIRRWGTRSGAADASADPARHGAGRAGQGLSDRLALTGSRRRYKPTIRRKPSGSWVRAIATIITKHVRAAAKASALPAQVDARRSASVPKTM